MNTHELALQLMAAQGLLGAFDTLYHHELTEALPQRNSAKLELLIHATRAIIYSVLFIGLSAWEWHGVWALVLLAVFAVEIVLTLWDFVIEDRTRLLPATERVTHTILAINGGAFITLLALNVPAWYAQANGFYFQSYGALSVFLVLCGIGVGLSGVRDAFAALQLEKNIIKENARAPIYFGDAAYHVNEHVLVTGATGFIGQQLVKALLLDHKKVSILTRHPKKAAWQFDGCVRCISNMSELPSHLKIDVIINLAGARILGWPWTAARQKTLRQSRIALTQQIVAWIAKAEHKPRLMLSASAIGYYGTQAQNDNSTLTESSPFQPIFMSQLCQDWEAAAQSAQAHGVNVICMRFGLVLGQQGALPMMLLPIKLGFGGPLGGGQQTLSWIHVHDVIRAMAHLWNNHTGGAYNFTAPETLTQKEFSETAARLMQRA